MAEEEEAVAEEEEAVAEEEEAAVAEAEWIALEDVRSATSWPIPLLGVPTTRLPTSGGAAFAWMYAAPLARPSSHLSTARRTPPSYAKELAGSARG